MSQRADNRLRERREARGLSQMELGTTARLSRQSIGAIESGRNLPGVHVALRLAHALGCTVEELFGPPASEPRVDAEPLGLAGVSGKRVALAHLSGRWVAYPLAGAAVAALADGLVVHSRRGRVGIEVLRPTSESRENVALMGCAAALGLLAARLSAAARPGRYIWMPASSTRALEALRRGRTHLAGVHLQDPKTGDANVADVRRHAGAEPLTVVTLARWEAGFVTAPGNPRRVLRAADLTRRGLRVVLREDGSGARRLLEQELARAHLSIRALSSTAVHAGGHLEVAQAVSIGAADVGVATRDAALAYDLGFVPLTDERYDLALPRASLQEPRLARLLDALTSGSFRKELSALGYDTAESGRMVAEIPPA